MEIDYEAEGLLDGLDEDVNLHVLESRRGGAVG